MRGKQAKLLRKLVYGDEFSHRHREFSTINNKELIKRDPVTKETESARLTFTLVDTGRRSQYQKLKTEYQRQHKMGNYLRPQKAGL